MQPNDRDEPPTLGQIDVDIPAMRASIADDGMPAPHAPLPGPSPSLPMTPATSPCLRGPCRHFMRVVTRFEAGNPEGTFELGKEPRQLTLFCDAIVGTYIEMSSDGFPLDCNRWDPHDPRELDALEVRRSRYYQEHPEDRPLSPEEVTSMVADEADEAKENA